MEYWDTQTLASRIANRLFRKRHEAGAPNPEEVQAYLAALPQHTGTAMVLGMTPELRTALLVANWEVVTADRNSQAMNLYRDWVPHDCAGRETLLLTDWLDLPFRLDKPADAILGDGVFGNLLSVQAHQELLDSLGRCLCPSGVMVFRQALLPDGPLEVYRAEHLLRAFREGQLDEPGFGLSMRLFGLLEEAYDGRTRLLDNSRVFEIYANWRDVGRLTSHEYDVVARYYFTGYNSLLPRTLWEDLLRQAGYRWETLKLSGRHWYEWYPLYRLVRIESTK